MCVLCSMFIEPAYQIIMDVSQRLENIVAHIYQFISYQVVDIIP